MKTVTIELLLTIFFFAFPSILVGQSTNDDKAKIEFRLAQENYDQKDYQAALKNLDMAINYLGNPNAKIQHLKIKCYYGLLEYTKTKNEIAKYYDLSSRDDDWDKEVYLISQEVDKKIKEAEFTQKQKEQEYKAWNKALELNTKEAFGDFIKAFPNSEKSNEAMEEFMYLSAKTSISIEIADSYLQRYPNGKYQKIIKERKIYLQGVSQGNIESLENYFLNYKNGKYYKEVTDKYQDELFNSAKKAGNNATAIELYKKYLNYFPNGKYAETAKLNQSKVQKEINLELHDKYMADYQKYMNWSIKSRNRGIRKFLWGTLFLGGTIYSTRLVYADETQFEYLPVLICCSALTFTSYYKSIRVFIKASEYKNEAKYYYNKAQSITYLTPYYDYRNKTCGLSIRINF